MSNSPQIANSAPATVSDLAGSTGRYNALLGRTAPGEDGAYGTATAYDVRYVTGATFTEGNWSTATSATGVPTPGAAGTSECMVISDLSGCTQYSFAVKTQDAVGQWSAISNIKTVTTKCSGSQSMSCGEESQAPELEGVSDLRLTLQGLQPNPTRTDGLIGYSIPTDLAGQELDLSIYDVTGRRTVTLATGAAIAGRHSSKWDLRSESGERARPGVYFVRLRLGETMLKSVVQMAP